MAGERERRVEGGGDELQRLGQVPLPLLHAGPNDDLEVGDERPDESDVGGVPLGGQDAGDAFQNQLEPERGR